MIEIDWSALEKYWAKQYEEDYIKKSSQEKISD